MKLLSSLFTLIAFLQVVNSAHALFGWYPVRGDRYGYGPYNTQYVQDVAAQTAAEVEAGVARTTPPVSYPVTGQPMYQYRTMQPAPEGRLMDTSVSPTARYYNQ